MLHKLKIFLGLALVACALTAYADPPGRVGRVNYAVGAVSFAPAEAPDQWVQAPLNRPLTAGDRLWADSNGRAEVHVGSTVLRMGAQTSVDVLNLDDHAIQLRLAQGNINLRVRELSQGDTIEIATPAGAVLVKQPGSYRVSADPQSGTSRVLVNFGQAEVVTPAQTFTVPSSQAASFAAGAGPSFEVAAYASSDELDRWSAERDRREDRITSTRYVSPQMTGYEDLDHYGSWRTLPEYGAVWVPARVVSGWAPYRHGHWVWVSPWGWTWVDDAPWGFAPFHYGRWVWHDNYWAWAPGRIAPRPVYAPALVAFVGGPHFSFTISSGPAVGWFPLGWRDPYFPSYRASPRYVHNVNVTHVTNITNVTNIYNNPTNVTNVNYVNRNNPQAMTVVPRQAFVSAKPVAQASVNVAPAQLAKAEVIQAKPAEPVRASFVAERPGQRPPAAAAAREVVAVTAPPKPVAQPSVTPQEGGAAQPRRVEHEPPVRVIGRADVRPPEKGAPQAGGPGGGQTIPGGAPGPQPIAKPGGGTTTIPGGAPGPQTAVKPGAATIPGGSPGPQTIGKPGPTTIPGGAPGPQPIAKPGGGTTIPGGSPGPTQIGGAKGPPAQHAPPGARGPEEAAGQARAAERREQRQAAPPEGAPRPPVERREPRRESAVSGGVQASSDVYREQRPMRAEPPASVRPVQAPPAQRAEQAAPTRAAQPSPLPRAEPPRAHSQPEAARAQAPQQRAPEPQRAQGAAPQQRETHRPREQQREGLARPAATAS